MISGTNPPRRPANWFAENLPNLHEGDCTLTSRCTYDYNCVGFVVGDFRWWHPEDLESHYWPDGIERDPRKWAHLYVTALETERFEPLDSVPKFDAAYENIVIFHKGGQFSHVALQVGESRWRSKLGCYEDLEHPLDAVLRGKYGQVFRYMRRDARFGRLTLSEEYRP
jgi:hypothetical protein